MADRYISREWLLKELHDILDGNDVRAEGEYGTELILNALKLLYSVAWNAPTFDQYQCSNKLLEARNFALKSRLDLLKQQLQSDMECRDFAECVNDVDSAQFCKGKIEATKPCANCESIDAVNMLLANLLTTLEFGEEKPVLMQTEDGEKWSS